MLFYPLISNRNKRTRWESTNTTSYQDVSRKQQTLLSWYHSHMQVPPDSETTTEY